MFYYSYSNIEKILGCESLRKKTKGDLFVIMGFQRSGTSLLANIVNSCGIFFGQEKELKQGLITNPDGFFEHKKISLLSWEYIKEARCRDSMNPDRNLSSNGWLNKIKRFLTVRSMHIALYTLSNRKSRWGIKNFPLFYYIWREYLPPHKIIAIYRNPYASAHSFMNIWPSKYTYEHVLGLWLQAQKDMIYHLCQTEHILIRYEDLIDKKTNSKILEKIIDFIGDGNISTLQQIIKPELNRTNIEISQLEKCYPLNQEIREVLDTLEKMKLSS